MLIAGGIPDAQVNPAHADEKESACFTASSR
jgi:hypothetical protein